MLAIAGGWCGGDVVLGVFHFLLSDVTNSIEYKILTNARF